MKKRTIFCGMSISTLVILLLFACSKKDSTDSSTSVVITALTCSGATFSTTAVNGTVYSGTATVPYTGGNGATYSAGSAISSTGVTGLTATLQAGTLASGAGSLTYTIAGTPTSYGTAAFAISLGGQSCSLSLTVDSAAVTADCSSAANTPAKVVCLAEAFEATLSSSQLSTLLPGYSQTTAIKWSNLPCGSSCRNGLQFTNLTSAQITAALAVVAAASGTVTDEGYSEITQIMAADDVLKTASGGSSYSSGIYFIAFLGTPSTTGTWQLQFGGHHLAVNITYKAGAVVGATPRFEGIEPKSWTTSGTTYAPLASEQSTMAAMLASLSTTELASAKLSTTFSDVLLGPNEDGQFPSTKVGLAVSSLTSAQQLLVLAAMKPWVQDVDDATAATLLATYQSELSSTYIAYSGNATLASNADYVRIDGPSVWIEFVCQTGVVYPSQIHYHSIWRDHTRDYGNSFTF
ncbi:Protein of unknown function [Chitinophaga sp. CF118]|uniref:DUF3500 domain-containing protein n=1 Tax=Chitinophaga sp. CF118 TaxID=1884367 RepID=UPI0008F26C6E|nr:DUF3500 domain-containing protein [Chitinophaga sp. CF118]SFE84602.1 Protein of unknown function [Chitinophaga sp. CF118]